MQLTKIDRMERIEHLIQSKIEQTEKDIASLKEMKDAEVCRMRRMYLMNLGELRENLNTLRHKIDLEYIRTRGGRRHGDENEDGAWSGYPSTQRDEWRGHHPAGRADEGHRVEPEHETDQQRMPQEPDGGAGHGSGVQHVGPNGGEIPGDYPAAGGRRTRVRRWQIEIMAREQPVREEEIR